MKSILIVLGLFLLSRSSLVAQDKGEFLDSLHLRLYNQAAPDTGRVNALNDLGYEYWVIDPVQSVIYGTEAIELADSLGYQSGMALARRVVGIAHWTQGNYEEGLSMLMDALVQYQSLKDSLGIANVLMNTGLIYSDQGSYEEALTYYEEAYRTFETLKKTDRQLHTSIHIGELHQSQNEYELARSYYQQALQLSDSIDHTYGLGTSYLHLGQLSLALGELDKALAYCQRALPHQETFGDEHGKASTYYTMGSIHRAQQQYPEANRYLQLALLRASEINSKKILRDTYQELKEVAQSSGQYRQALDYLEKYVSWQDSLLNAEKLREIVRLENQHELKQKEQELLVQEQSVALLRQEARIQNIFRNGLLIGIVALACMGYLVTSRQRLKIKKNQELITKNREIFSAKEALAQSELENAQLRQKELSQELEYKNKELTSYTINFIQKNELIEELKQSIQQMKRNSNGAVKQQLNTLSRLVDQNLHIDREWEDFKRHFEEVHKDFFTLLKKRCPELSSNELKICALLKLNMSMKEMANVLGISPDSVKTARYRLRKKLGLDRDENLVDSILTIERSATEVNPNHSDY